MFNKRFIFTSLGIFVCYFYFGILQETITKGRYPNKELDEHGHEVLVNEKYTYMLALCGSMSFINYVFAKILIRFWSSETNAEDKTKPIYYMTNAFTYILAMVASNTALQFVNYPTQVVAKSAKPIPVLLLGVLIGKKSYTLQKYFFVLLIVTGVSLFMFKDKPTAKAHNESEGFGLGEVLLILSLILDGITGGIQDRMRAESAPSATQLMMNMNYWASILLGVALVVFGEGYAFVLFVARHPSVVYNILILSACNALGQFFILLMVTDFGPLACSIVTTTRKFFTVLFSVLFFGNALTNRQWIGAIIVFTTLFLDAFFGKSPSRNKK